MTLTSTKHNSISREGVVYRDLPADHESGYVIRYEDRTTVPPQIVTVSKQPGHTTVAVDAVPHSGRFPLETEQGSTYSFSPGKAVFSDFEAIAVQLDAKRDHSEAARFILDHIGFGLYLPNPK